MKKTFTILLLAVVLLTGANCSKDSTDITSSYSESLYFRGEGINVDNVASSYSSEVKVNSRVSQPNDWRTDEVVSYTGDGNGQTLVELLKHLTIKGQAVLRVTNLGTCNTDISVFFEAEMAVKNFDPNEFDTVCLNLPASGQGLFYVIPAIECDGSDPTDIFSRSFYTGDLSPALTLVPIHFQSFKVRKLADWIYRVDFIIDDLTDARHVNIQVSASGRDNWRTVKEIPATDIKLGNEFTTDVSVK